MLQLSGMEEQAMTAKRVFDVVVASCALLISWPLILAGAIAVKLTSPGPAFYLALRAGLGGRPFHMYKLRTMRVGSATPDSKITAARDSRVTAVGQLLRRLKIDELPQFWNVLCGDMSIVGPRPEDWELVERYYSAEQRRVLEIRPGIASLAEVDWYPDLTHHDPPPPGVPIQEHYLQRHLPLQVEAGIRYMERQSLLLDLKILVQVAFNILVYSWAPPTPQPPAADTPALAHVGRRPAAMEAERSL
jgi:lipopolysaccharide/colanic/teichoic acid biosynthesis glycosyltransferase